MMPTSDKEEAPPTLLNNLLVRCIGNLVNHPFEYSKLLIQLGYEPFPPVPGKYLTSRVLYYPNVFQYVKYIKRTDGLAGLYRGLAPRLITNSIHYVVSNKLLEYCPVTKNYVDLDDFKSPSKEPIHPYLGAKSELEYKIKKTAYDVVCYSAGVVASHPFQVVAVRMMGEFVGREGVYSNLLSSITTIYKQDGVLGFFTGLAPRLIGEGLYILIATGVVYVLNKVTKRENVPAYFTTLVGNYTASTLTYQLHLVSNNMIANGSGLAIGSPPYTPYYNGDWLTAWAHLKSAGQLGRGASMLGRIYGGQVSKRGGGDLVPVGGYFGPVHPEGLWSVESKAAGRN